MIPPRLVNLENERRDFTLANFRPTRSTDIQATDTTLAADTRPVARCSWYRSALVLRRPLASATIVVLAARANSSGSYRHEQILQTPSKATLATADWVTGAGTAQSAHQAGRNPTNYFSDDHHRVANCTTAYRLTANTLHNNAIP